MKAHESVDVLDPHFLDLGTSWRWVVSSLPGHFTARKEPPVPIGQEVGWTSDPVWTAWRRYNSWSYQDSNFNPLVVQPVASRYTDYAIQAPYNAVYSVESLPTFRKNTSPDIFVVEEAKQETSVKQTATDQLKSYRKCIGCSERVLQRIL
jgi:hypothetical protein